jgi:hypothetical protein
MNCSVATRGDGAANSLPTDRASASARRAQRRPRMACGRGGVRRRRCAPVFVERARQRPALQPAQAADESADLVRAGGGDDEHRVVRVVEHVAHGLLDELVRDRRAVGMRPNLQAHIGEQHVGLGEEGRGRARQRLLREVDDGAQAEQPHVRERIGRREGRAVDGRLDHTEAVGRRVARAHRSVDWVRRLRKGDANG